MGVTAEQERAFYDDIYAQFLSMPVDSLVFSRATLEADLANPAHPVWERRALYKSVLQTLDSRDLRNKVALDYGCGTGDWGLLMGYEGAMVTCLDLSPVAAEVVRRRAEVSGLSDRVTAVAQDASDLRRFPDEQFDLVYASAAIHHTLKYPNALQELVRVLKPGGLLLLAETYGNNPVLDNLRRLRWRLARQPAEAGEDILFGDQELRLLSEHFRILKVSPMNLLAMGKRFFRGHFHRRSVRSMIGLLESCDSFLFSILPGCRRYCGEVLVLAAKK